MAAKCSGDKVDYPSPGYIKVAKMQSNSKYTFAPADQSKSKNYNVFDATRFSKICFSRFPILGGKVLDGKTMGNRQARPRLPESFLANAEGCESWKVGRLEGWRVGGLEGWRFFSCS
jgi:hypothetical protein